VDRCINDLAIHCCNGGRLGSLAIDIRKFCFHATRTLLYLRFTNLTPLPGGGLFSSLEGNPPLHFLSIPDTSSIFCHYPRMLMTFAFEQSPFGNERRRIFPDFPVERKSIYRLWNAICG
jgi:hypothetical protein